MRLYQNYKKKIATAILLSIPLLINPATHNQKWMTRAEIKCLDDNIYYEARGESELGMLLVAKTTINRARNSDICKVVYQKNQFSWTSYPRSKPDPKIYKQIEQLDVYSIKSNAMYFHNTKVHPKWAKYKVVIAKEGNHIFYD